MASFLPARVLNLAVVMGVLIFHRHIPGGFIAHKGGDLGNDLPELLGAGALIPQDGELVLQQRVVQNVYLFHVHGIFPFYLVFSAASSARSLSSRSRSA